MTSRKVAPGEEDPSTHTASNRHALSFVFRLYKYLLSPLLHAVSRSRCVYLPTCSEYAYTAISRFGWMRGGWLAMRRLSRCHPWAEGGVDPVPAFASTEDRSSSRLAPLGPNHNGADHLP